MVEVNGQTTDSNHASTVAENVPDREFDPEKSSTSWLAVARVCRIPQNYSTFPQSLMVTLADVFPLREPTASICLTTS